MAAELGRDPESVRAEAAGYLREMAASLDERAVQAWRGFSRWLMRAYDVLVDEDQIAQLRKLGPQSDAGVCVLASVVPGRHAAARGDRGQPALARR